MLLTHLSSKSAVSKTIANSGENPRQQRSWLVLNRYCQKITQTYLVARTPLGSSFTLRGTQSCADRHVSLTREIFRLPLNSSVVLWVRKEVEIQIHDDGKDWAPDPFGNNLQQLDILSFFPCQRLEPWPQNWSCEHSIIPSTAQTTGLGQVLLIGSLPTQAQ